MQTVAKLTIVTGLFLHFAVSASAQSEGTLFHNMVERVTKFGERIPQEKVYVHMDNTSYLHGDTIWFKAYLRRTDTDKPSNVSHTLYVELRALGRLFHLLSAHQCRDTQCYADNQHPLHQRGGEDGHHHSRQVHLTG